MRRLKWGNADAPLGRECRVMTRCALRETLPLGLVRTSRAERG